MGWKPNIGIDQEQMTQAISQISKVFESMHGYLEIIAREQIRARLELRKSNVTNEEIEAIIWDYQENVLK